MNSYDHGHRDGMKYDAPAIEVQRLQEHYDNLADEPVYGWEFWFTIDNDAYTPGEHLFFILGDQEENRDRDEAQSLWDSIDECESDDSDYVRGFADGILEKAGVATI